MHMFTVGTKNLEDWIRIGSDAANERISAALLMRTQIR